MKFLKRFLLGIAALLLLLEFAILISGKTYLNRLLLMTILSGKMAPDIDELHKFPSRKIENGVQYPWPLSANYNRKKVQPELIKKIEAYQTTAFLVIKNDSILYENYWEGYDSKSYFNSFSMAKSFLSCLIGIALHKGLIGSVDQPVSDFIPEFATKGKEAVTLKHLLTMSSGLDFDEAYNSPFAWPSEAYYGNDVNGLTLKAGVKEQPGIFWKYKGGDTQLLGIILKKATGMNPSEFASAHLWKEIGAEQPAYWSLDKKDGMEKVSCCYYSSARDFARLARLYMSFGNWNGKQIIDTGFVLESLTPARLKDENGNTPVQYGYQWWLLKHKGHNIYYCRGIRGQYIFAIPAANLIIVRTGHKRADKKGDELPNDIFVYLDAGLNLK